MKKIFFVMVLLCCSTLIRVNAQGKTGYISIDEVVSLMPETYKIDSLLDRYKTDSISPVYNQLAVDYGAQVKIYNDSVKNSLKIRQDALQTLNSISAQLSNWEQIQNQALENKRNALLNPIYRKVYAAVKAVAAEKGYAHVLNKEAYLVAPTGEDLLPAVAAKLKIVLPKNVKTGVDR
jgi:outer membrane protein